MSTHTLLGFVYLDTRSQFPATSYPTVGIRFGITYRGFDYFLRPIYAVVFTRSVYQIVLTI
ncbi:MAG: hypothetical protein F6J90_37445 [Moorea sp. SIOASIH]|nr:hypothetical protein [Moorena sp. SIOASIH]NEO38683.1 hypothetical protein [Moorena sp. SIOASIH]NEO41705.1 hypothetical protein [Moorena sp. SIOASIH]